MPQWSIDQKEETVAVLSPLDLETITFAEYSAASGYSLELVQMMFDDEDHLQSGLTTALTNAEIGLATHEVAKEIAADRGITYD